MRAHLIFWFLVLSSTLIAQDIRLAYLGHVLVQPGFEAGLSYSIKDSLFKNPGVRLLAGASCGYFSQQDVHRSFLSQVELGVQFKGKRLAHTLNATFGYLHESDFQEATVNLGTGDINNETREVNPFFVTQLAYEFGRGISDRLSWYVRSSFGLRFSRAEERRAMLFLGGGLQYRLKGP